MRKTAAVLTMALAALAMARAAEAQVPPATTVIHSIAGQGKLAVSWNAVATATLYQLWVEDSVGTPVYQVLTPSLLGCGSGTGTCSAFSDVAVVPGPYTTRVASWNISGYSDWSPPYEAASLPMQPRVLDQNNEFVGTLADPSRIYVTVGGNITEIAVVKRQIYLLFPPTLLFAELNCQGQSYNTAVLPNRLQFAGSLANGWRTHGPPSTITVKSVQQRDSNNVVTSCDPTMPQYQETVMQANPWNGVPQFGGFVPPFKAVQ